MQQIHLIAIKYLTLLMLNKQKMGKHQQVLVFSTSTTTTRKPKPQG